jgi:hypothetical protein
MWEKIFTGEGDAGDESNDARLSLEVIQVSRE